MMHIDTYSQTWLAIDAYLKERLASLRAQLEGDQPEDKTLRIRARIAEIKQLLDLANPEAPLVEPPEELPG